MRTSTLTSTSSTRVGAPRAHEVNRAVSVLRENRDRGRPMPVPGRPLGVAPRTEQWVTKRELATHLKVTTRWIELQYPHGLPHLRRGRIVRYRISEVESWLHSSATRVSDAV
jgi:hypothetical protein